MDEDMLQLGFDSAANTGMHRCLRLTEIQAQIFGYLNTWDCTQLALTCSSFYECACDVVWAEVETMIPFARCMPPEVLVELEPEPRTYEPDDSDAYFGPDDMITNIDLRRPLDLFDWKLFCKHTHRVKVYKDERVYIEYVNTIGFGRRKCQLATNAMRTIISWIQSGSAGGDVCENAPPHLFPKLTTLIMPNEFDPPWVPAYFPDLCRSGTLQRLVLDWKQDTDALDSMSSPGAGLYSALADVLPGLTSAWPQLRSIELITRTTMHARQVKLYLESAMTWLNSVPHLQSFRASLSLHPSLVDSLSKLPLLHNVELEGHEGCTIEPGSRQQLSPSGFSSLRTLKLTSYEPHTPTPLLHALDHCSLLTEVKLNYSYTQNLPNSFDQVIALFEAVSHIPTVETLHIALGKRSNSPGRPKPREPTLSGQLLRILFSLPRVRDLELAGFYDISLEDSDLENVASAWPGLVTFDLGRTFDSPLMVKRPPLTTLVGVQALYNGCPNLAEVYLYVTEKLPVDSNFILTLPSARPRDGAMKSLHLAFCPHRIREGVDFEYGSGTYIPIIIRLMFPQLEEFVAFTIDDRYPRWESDTWAGWDEYKDVETSKVLDRLTEIADGILRFQATFGAYRIL